MKRARTHSDLPQWPAVFRVFIITITALWLLSLLHALLLSRPLRDLDGFQWIFFDNPAFDYFDYIGLMYYLHRPEFFTHPGYPWYYPAAAVFPLRFFYSIGDLTGDWLGGYLTYIAVAISGAAFAAWKLASSLKNLGISRGSALLFTFVTACLSWPIYFSLQRGNIEAVTWLLLAAAIWAYAKQRWMLAAILLGLVTAFKFYPGLCFGLFISPRRWRELIAGLLTTALVTVSALLYIGPDLLTSFRGTSDAMAKWIDAYARFYGAASGTYDHSFYELTKLATLFLHPDYPTLLNRYMVVVAILAAIIFFARIIHLPRTNQVLFLVAASVSLPPASFDYTLQNMYIPFALLVLATAAAWQQHLPARPLNCALILLALLFAPETFLMGNRICFAGPFKSLALLALMVIAAVFPMPDLPTAPAQHAGTEDRTASPALRAI